MPPENLEKKIEQTTKTVQAFQLLWKEIKKILYAVIVFMVGVYGAFQNKEALADFIMKDVTKDHIHNEVVKEAEHYAHSKLREKDSIYIAEIEEKTDKAYKLALSTAKASTRIKELEELVKYYNDKIVEFENHNKYCEGAFTNLVEAISEQMEPANGCNFKYYKSHHGDGWVVVEDAYGIHMIYPFEKRSNCKGYYTDIHTGNRIQIR